MEYWHLNLRHGQASAIVGAILICLNTAPSQAITISLPGQPPLSIHRVADTKQEAGPGGFADLAEKIRPAIIGVASKATSAREAVPGRSFGFGIPNQGPLKKEAPGSRGFGSGEAPNTIEAISIGSGFFISPDGYAVTNSHVVEDSNTAEVRTSDDKTYSARVVGKDSLSDLALIKVDGRTDFSYMKFADQPPRVGDWLLTAGNAFGLGGTVTAGIVSARDREIETGPAEGFLQIDAPINRGDSGGPSLNTDGDVIGVNSMIISPSGGSSGVAFAVPADTAKFVISQLRDKGAVTRGHLGAEIQTVTPEISDSLSASNLHGAIVAKVQDNSPAAKAGLKIGDIITSAGGASIKNANELTKKIRVMTPGSTVQIALVRSGKESSLNVTLDRLPDQPRSSEANPR